MLSNTSATSIGHALSYSYPKESAHKFFVFLKPFFYENAWTCTKPLSLITSTSFGLALIIHSIAWLIASESVRPTRRAASFATSAITGSAAGDYAMFDGKQVSTKG